MGLWQDYEAVPVPLLGWTRNRNIQHGLHRLDVGFGVLHPDEVLVMADRIDPEVLLVELNARIERGDDVLDHIGLRPVPRKAAFALSMSIMNSG